MKEFTETIQDFDGGVFAEKVSRGLAATALGTVNYGERGKKGKVTIELTLERIGESSQVQIDHKVVTTIPQPRGKVSEEDTTQTAMYVGKAGVLSIAPADQIALFEKE